ncbi:vegetative cell wall protein gp1-like [Miscanthus floridulus]|uniref:vegetative cell wall protein gp1-like n=1 Tax=Miscanthus floridulus TaxID=154761 RepID=UPI00345ADD95
MCGYLEFGFRVSHLALLKGIKKIKNEIPPAPQPLSRPPPPPAPGPLYQPLPSAARPAPPEPSATSPVTVRRQPHPAGPPRRPHPTPSVAHPALPGPSAASPATLRRQPCPAASPAALRRQHHCPLARSTSASCPSPPAVSALPPTSTPPPLPPQLRLPPFARRPPLPRPASRLTSAPLSLPRPAPLAVVTVAFAPPRLRLYPVVSALPLHPLPRPSTLPLCLALPRRPALQPPPHLSPPLLLTAGEGRAEGGCEGRQ